LEESTIPELEEKATKIRVVLMEVLNRKAKKRMFSARSIRWWNQTIKENKRILGFWKREKKAARWTEDRIK
jgi:predicted acetyltransferase